MNAELYVKCMKNARRYFDYSVYFRDTGALDNSITHQNISAYWYAKARRFAGIVQNED